jgi:hypothetical protein
MSGTLCGATALTYADGSFVYGFKLAWQMANKLNNYDNRRSTPAKQAGLSAYSVLPKEN